jgi:hypothetical protein
MALNRNKPRGMVGKNANRQRARWAAAKAPVAGTFADRIHADRIHGAAWPARAAAPAAAGMIKLRRGETLGKTDGCMPASELERGAGDCHH